MNETVKWNEAVSLVWVAFLAYFNFFCFFTCLCVNFSEADTTTLNKSALIFRVSLFTNVYPRHLFLKLNLSTHHSLLFPLLSSSTIYIYFQHWGGRSKCPYNVLRMTIFTFLFFFSLDIQKSIWIYNISWLYPKLTPQITPMQLIDKKVRQIWTYCLPWWR